jgi:hypothetical protein
LREGPDEKSPKLVVRAAVGRQKSHEIEEVILGEYTVVDALESRVALNCLRKRGPFSPAEIPAEQVADRKLPFSAVVQ